MFKHISYYSFKTKDFLKLEVISDDVSVKNDYQSQFIDVRLKFDKPIKR